MLALPVLIGAASIAPSDALAEQSNLTAASKLKSVSGHGWKLSIPSYWRSRVKSTSYSYNGNKNVRITPKGKLYMYNSILYLYEYSASTAKSIKQQTRSLKTSVKLKNGKKVTLRTGADGEVRFLVKLSSSRYLSVSTMQCRKWMSGVDATTEKKLRYLAKLQTFGKKSTYTNSNAIPIACLKVIAKRLSV